MCAQSPVYITTGNDNAKPLLPTLTTRFRVLVSADVDVLTAPLSPPFPSSRQRFALFDAYASANPPVVSPEIGGEKSGYEIIERLLLPRSEEDLSTLLISTISRLFLFEMIF